MVIYTKRGDRGETSLYDKSNAQRERVSKNSAVVQVLGAIDELNSYLGICVSYCENPKFIEILESVQRNLLRIGTIIAGSGLNFSKNETTKLEKVIDELEGKLPVLKNFVVPGGSKLSAHLHFARAMSRRAERRVVALSKQQKIPESILTYMNRLSDFLFMLAREANYNASVGDEVWKGTKK